MATAGSIVVSLLMATGQFETDTKRAESIAKKRAEAIDKAFSEMGRKIGLAATATRMCGIPRRVAATRPIMMTDDRRAGRSTAGPAREARGPDPRRMGGADGECVAPGLAGRAPQGP